jgi:hypothetical protein
LTAAKSSFYAIGLENPDCNEIYNLILHPHITVVKRWLAGVPIGKNGYGNGGESTHQCMLYVLEAI